MHITGKIISFLGCLTLLYTVGCTLSAPANRPPSDVGPTYVAPAGAGPATLDGVEYEYVATSEREAQIVAGFPKLKTGQSREDVRDTLGPPDRAIPAYGKAYSAPFRGWAYLYKIKMRSQGPNTNDICVNVYFDPDGNLDWAVPSNIAGLTEVGRVGGP